jgi:Asp/Glu/hydantoin racemase
LSKKVGFIHTGVPIASFIRKVVGKRLPHAQAFHIVDESLLQDLLRSGTLTPSIVKRLCAQVTLAREAGADPIMVTCSSVGPGVKVARQLVDAEVLRIDEPMAERAVEMASRIGVLATAETTLVPSSDLIKEKAGQRGKTVTVETMLSREAFGLFLRGDINGHDQAVKQSGMALVGKVELLVLAQASMSNLAAPLQKAAGVPVLASPDLAMDVLKRILQEG